jgi:hypothetical protein
MAEPLSDDLRKRIVEAVEGGQSRRAAAQQFNIGITTAVRWIVIEMIFWIWSIKRQILRLRKSLSI